MNEDIYEPIDHLQNDYELAEHLQNNLIARATGLDYDSRNYKIIRQKLMVNQEAKELLPDFVRKYRDIQQFWIFIKEKYQHYAERRTYIYEEFEPLLSFLEERELNRGSSLIGMSSIDKVDTIDKELNLMIEEAKERFKNPKDRKIVLEKLWDAFERIKTFYGKNKKISAEELVKNISSDFDYEFIKAEFELLSKIGNNYNIRHHEQGKIFIKNDKHVEYLFFRMLALLNLCVANIQERKLSN